MKWEGLRPKQVAMRRNCLSLAKQRPLRLRSRWRALSQAHEKLAAACRDHRLGTERLHQRQPLPAVMAFAGQDVLGLEPGQQRWRLRDVVTLPASGDKPQRPARAIHRHVDLRARTSRARHQSRVHSRPFSGRCLCVRPDNAAAGHQVPVASILNQGLKHLLPDALGRPAGKSACARSCRPHSAAADCSSAPRNTTPTAGH